MQGRDGEKNVQIKVIWWRVHIHIHLSILGRNLRKSVFVFLMEMASSRAMSEGKDLSLSLLLAMS